MNSAEGTEKAEVRGFIRGVAWCIALMTRFHIDAGGLLKESGIEYEDFRKAKVVEADLRAIRKVAKYEGISLTSEANHD